MDPRLQQAIEHDDVDELHSFIVEEPKLLDRACKDPFPNTPLHVAAAAGKTQVAIEMAIMKPSFARKLNPEGYSPMHLALQYEHYQTARALMKFDPKLIRVQGRRGITPLHYLAEKEGGDELELLAEFLVGNKSSIEDLTSRCETAVHVAVRNHNLKAFKVLFGWLKRESRTKILNWKDQDGNTVLHIAVSEEQPEITKLLLGYTGVYEKNFQDKTALEIFQANPSGNQDVAKSLRSRKCLARFLPSTLSPAQCLSRELNLLEKITVFFGISVECLNKMLILLLFLIAAASCRDSVDPLEGYWWHSSSNLPANSTVVTTNSSGTAVGKPHQAGNPILHDWLLHHDAAINTFFYFSCAFLGWIGCVKTQMPYAYTVYGLLFPLIVLSYASLQVKIPELIEVIGLGASSSHVKHI